VTGAELRAPILAADAALRPAVTELPKLATLPVLPRDPRALPAVPAPPAEQPGSAR
jgi:hypothetical protein